MADTKLYEKLLLEINNLDNKNEQFIWACTNGDDETSLKLLKYLSSREIELFDVLNNDDCRQLFKEFCQRELSTENIDFWEECMEYKEWENKGQRLVHARHLYNNFISPKSRAALNISADVAKIVEKRIVEHEENIPQDDNLTDIFAPVKKQAEICMSDTFPRFVRDQYYKLLNIYSVKFDKILDRKNNNATLMHLCAQMNKVQCIQFLSCKGIDIDCMDQSKSTPLTYAMVHGSYNAALFLIRKGASIYLSTASDKFPFTDELKNKYSRMTELLFDESLQNAESIQRFEEEYKKIGEAKNFSLLNLHKDTDNMKTSSLSDGYSCHVSSILYIVEHQKTMRRYNAFCITFREALHAIQYRNSNWRQYNGLSHENIVPIHDIFLHKAGPDQFKVYIIKVSELIHILFHLLKC